MHMIIQTLHMNYEISYLNFVTYVNCVKYVLRITKFYLRIQFQTLKLKLE